MVAEGLNMPPTLLPHQLEGVRFLKERKAGLLAFEQGLGKTLTALVAFAELRAEGRVSRLFVICPNSLKGNWAAEVARFCPELSTAVIDAAGRARRRALAGTRADIIIVNYEAVRGEVTVLRGLLSARPCALVLDESHAIKNTATISHTAASNLGELTPYRWLLSGTPYTNSVTDLYAQLAFVDNSGALGPEDCFVAKFGDAAEEPAELRAVLAKHVLRRTKAQCLSLPAKLFEDRVVPLPDWQMELYAAVRDRLIGDVAGMTAKEFQTFLPKALNRLLRLWQVASNPALVFKSEARLPAKFAALDAALADFVVARGQKVIVWSSFVETIKALHARYAPRFETAMLYGEVSSEDRTKAVARFQESAGPMVLLANPAVAATGFTMTASNVAIYETMSWRYDFFAQSQDRNHRIGQLRDVTYLRLIAGGTVDEQIVKRVEKKAQAAAAMLDGAEKLADEKFTQKEFLSLVREPMTDENR
ncbi:MAG TPA: DEAD/DEAH box helicase [Candidatus Didemnitutus sp.]|nr:DEAD/DEAH box helicase [Candidatus Didemnitutus sp.]